MGCQGEIYNVLGIKVPAKKEKKEVGHNEVIYSINRITCGSEDDDVDLYNGISTNFYGAADLKKKLRLVTRILGHNDWMADRHFDGEALVGVAISNECYIDNASELPPQADIDAIKPSVVKLIKKELNLDIEESDLKMFIIFDSLNGG